ncbi:MAG TPA: sigma-54 dependent transcriptional regulator [Casimicrobiaceae bacterium]|nr:sigma-54 dependent transcriptional regulator [Casimicrobiaceae bacterium]
MPHALIVDDDPTSRSALADLIARDGFTTSLASSLAEARELFDPVPDLVLVDLVLPDGSGMELLSEPSISQQSDIVLITGHGSVESSVNAMRLGAVDYLTKPLDTQKLQDILNRHAPAQSPHGRTGFVRLIGNSPPMQKLFTAMARIAPTDATVLIIGESGTGKDLVAQTLHELSPRASGPYLAVNCGAVSPNLIESELFGHEKGSFTGATRQHTGFFERAHGGTLFLDEVTEMPPDLQVRLLRVLETRSVSRVGSTDTIHTDVRVIAATNRDPYQAVKAGKLREDLLYRLQVVPLHVPPLRERRGDIAVLTSHFLAQLNEKGQANKVFSASAIERMERYDWPGNVRELCNVVQRAWILADGRAITQPVLQRETVLGTVSPAATGFQVTVGESLAEVERRLILHTVQRCRTREEAARILKISTKTLYNKLRVYEAGARWRESHGGSVTSSWGPQDTDKSVQ